MSHKAPPAFDFFYQDFRDGVRRLTRDQIGAYILLLIEQFEVGSFPENPSVLSGIISTSAENCTDEQFQKIWSAIKDKFDEHDGCLRNSKMDVIREKTFKRWNANRENGKKGGRPKKPKRNPSVPVDETQTKPNGKREGGSRKKEDKEKETVSIDLSQFDSALGESITSWLAYKIERNEGYKPVGLKSFLSQIAKAEAKHGYDAVVDSIEGAMADGWKGWRHGLKENNGKQQKTFDELKLERTAKAVREFG